MIMWTSTRLICAPERGMAEGKDASLAIIWVLHPNPTIKAENVRAPKDRTPVSEKLFRYLF